MELFEGVAFESGYGGGYGGGMLDDDDFGFSSRPPTPEAIRPLPAPTAQVAAAVNAAARATTNVVIPPQMRLDREQGDFDVWR